LRDAATFRAAPVPQISDKTLGQSIADGNKAALPTPPPTLLSLCGASLRLGLDGGCTVQSRMAELLAGPRTQQ